MYYLRDGLGYKLLGSIFAGCTMFGAITVGNFAQINSIVLPLQSAGIHPLTASIILALLVAAVIMGGIQRVARFSSVIVPVQAILYFGAAIWILTSYHQQILPALQLMFHSAFDTSSFVGGTLGMGMMQAITTGFDRGLFATDAGTGIVPILQASARSEQPVRDGLVTLVAPLMVMLVCTLTGLVLLVTGAWQEPGLQSTNMVTHAFSRGMDHPAGAWIVMIALLLFAYTTILAWSYCGEKALEFLSGSSRQKNWFRLGFVMLVPVGSLLQVDLIWILADIAIGFMLLINLIGITGLSRQVIAESRAHSVPIVSRS
jgi:AGCS family alanine or glycine:cation symporter